LGTEQLKFSNTLLNWGYLWELITEKSRFWKQNWNAVCISGHLTGQIGSSSEALILHGGNSKKHKKAPKNNWHVLLPADISNIVLRSWISLEGNIFKASSAWYCSNSTS